MNTANTSNAHIIIPIVMIVGFLLAMFLETQHIENMAKMGYQQCKIGNEKIWQKECYNFFE